jgi:hypothetical protein
MNQWIASAFGTILTFGHFLALIVGFVAYMNGKAGVEDLILYFVIYILVVGTMSVFISINERLGEIRDILKQSNRTQ